MNAAANIINIRIMKNTMTPRTALDVPKIEYDKNIQFYKNMTLLFNHYDESNKMFFMIQDAGTTQNCFWESSKSPKEKLLLRFLIVIANWA